MNKFWAILEYIQDKMKVISAVCLAGMVVLTCIDVVGRLLNHPIFGAEEIVAILSTCVIALSLPYAHKEKCHIGVEILMRLFSLKTQAVVKLLTNVLALVLFLIVTWRMVLYAQTMHRVGEVSMNLQFPTYYIIYLLSFCFFVFSLFILKDIVKFFKK